MEKRVYAEVVDYKQWRHVEKVMCGDRISELVPGDVHSTITLSAHGRELKVEVQEEVLAFLGV